MSRVDRITFATIACVALPTCGAIAQSKAQVDADTKEIASYRLTLDALKKVERVSLAMVDEMKKDPKFQAAMKLEAEQEALQKSIDRRNEKEELTEAEALVTALHREGMSPREYSKFMLTFIQAALVHRIQKSGLGMKELPPEVNAENVK